MQVLKNFKYKNSLSIFSLSLINNDQGHFR